MFFCALEVNKIIGCRLVYLSICHSHDLVTSRLISKGTCLLQSITSFQTSEMRQMMRNFADLIPHKSTDLVNNMCFGCAYITCICALDAISTIVLFFFFFSKRKTSIHFPFSFSFAFVSYANVAKF